MSDKPNPLDDPSRNTKMLMHEGIELNPLAGFATATISANGALLTIEYLLPPPATQTGILKLGMTRAQCTELSQALARLAVLPYRPQTRPS